MNTLGGDLRERECKEAPQGEKVCSHFSFLEFDRRGNIMLRASLCLIIRGGGRVGTGTWSVNQQEAYRDMASLRLCIEKRL